MEKKKRLEKPKTRINRDLEVFEREPKGKDILNAGRAHGQLRRKYGMLSGNAVERYNEHLN